MKKILLLSFFFCCFYFASNKVSAQIGYKFTGSQASNAKSGDLKNVVSNLNSFTYEFWANRSNISGATIFTSIVSNNTEAGGFGIFNGQLVVSLSSNFGIGYTASTTLPGNSANVWHHYAFVFNAGNWSFYFDGVLVGGNLPDQEGLAQTPAYSGIGATFFNAGSQQSGVLPNFDGSMDDIRVWNTARTATQINNSRLTELTGSEPGLVAYYKLNEQSGQIVTDSGPNGLNGVLGSTTGVEPIDPAINVAGRVAGYPLATTTGATAITGTGATLSGTINDNGNATTTSFDYGTSATLAGASSINAAPATVTAGTGNTVVSATPAGLNPSTTYYYRSKGVNSAGTTLGSILNFTTTAPTPVITLVTNGVTSPFFTSYGTASGSKYFILSGTNLTAGVLITPPAGGFEVSTDNVNFSPTLTVGGAGSFGPSVVYIRIAASAPVAASITGNIQFSSPGATSPPTIALPINTLVTKAPLTITVNAQTKVYGASLPTLTASYSGFVNGDTPASLTTPTTLTTTATAASAVAGSPYAITASGAAGANYTISYVQGNLTVTPAPLTITATNQTKAYGAAVPALVASYTGFVNGDTPISLTTLPTLTTTATAASAVAGSPYAITASGAVNTNYSISYVPGNLTITTVPLTITVNNQTKTYGAAVPALTASYTGFVNGDTPISFTTLPTLTTTATAASSVAGSPYAITASGAVNTNYTISYVPGTLAVTAAPLTITVNNQTKTYGAALPTLTASYTGFVNGDTPVSLTTLPTLTTTATAASSVAGSPYAITASGAVSANYTISYVPGILAVTAAPLTITASNKTKAYGAAVPALTATYAGFVNGDTPAGLITPPTLTTTATAASSVAGGPYAITASGAASANYSISYVPGSLAVTAAPLTITASNKTKAYGAAVPALTATYAGFVNGDTPAGMFTPPTLTTTATAASSVAGSPYAITASGAVNTNYAISYVPGSLAITAAPLTITADNQTKAYGAAVPALTASYTGFVNGDTPAGLITPPILTTTATAASSVAGSPYAITASGAISANYTISYVPGILAITAAPLTITADNQTKAYGAAVPALTASYTGFVNGDTPISLITLPTLTTTATAASSVAGSPYAITASGAVSANYAISYVPGNLAITAAPLTITVNNQTKVYGASIPTLTASYTGFVNGDTPISLTTLPTLSTTATAASSVAGSPYAITASGAVNTNYTISYVPGNLTITAALLTITADNQTKAYGAALPALTASYTGFVNGDTQASLATAPTLTTTATAASSVAGSPYAITASGAVTADYTISYVPGSLTITAAPLTITADNQTKAYGAALPALTASYTGFVNGDTQAGLATAPTLTTTATAASSVAGSPYAITASGAFSADYTISYVPGNLTITAAPLTITADNQTKAYGAALPALTASYTGFVNGDTQAGLATAPTLTTTATAASSVAGSPYAITASGAVSADYTISYVPGNLTITAAPLTITADNQTKAYGAALPALTASYTGFVNGDTQASLATAPTLTTTATAASSVAGSPYAITASGAVTADYTISYVPGNLTITAAPLTITADNQTKAYGAALPALTASYTGFVNGDTQASLATAPTLTTTATAASSVAGSPYAITASGAVTADYTISYVPGNLTITAAPLTITADNQTKAYGAALPALTASYTGFVNGDTQAGLASAPTLTTTATAASSVAGSPYAITASGAVSADYTISYVPGNLTITTVPLTITADNQTKAYGAPLPALTASYTGFVNGDNQASLTNLPTLTTTATATSPVAGSPYVITASGAVSADYTINYVPGNLTINTLAVTVTADTKSKTYGDADPALTYQITSGTLAPSDSFTGTLTRASGENVNTYAITQGTLTLNNNYVLTYVPANLTIGTKAVTVTANAQTKAYGTADPALTYQITSGNLVGSDSFTGSLTRAPGESVNTYAITQGTLALNSNYVLNYTGANLTITKRVLTITANNQNKVYGSANPSFTVSYSGFLGGDNPSILTSQPVISTTASTGSGVNTYPITVSGAAVANYDIVYVPGTLTVSKAVLTITADNKSRSYGLNNPPFTLAYSGFVNGDDMNALSAQPAATSTATTTTAPGNYPITVNGAASANYSFNYVNGNLTIIAVSGTNVSNLTTSSGTLSPAFTPANHSYTTSVDNGSDNIRFTVTFDPTATVKINGSTAPNGSSSAGVPLSVGNNTITIVVTAQDGVTTNTYTVTVYRGEPATSITATNILTPNGDGKNDTWVIEDIQLYPKNSVTVYDRAGRKVYFKQGYTNDWDGTLNGAPLVQGTYYYTVDLGPGLPKFRGFITLLRGN
ncbi:gliding motility-associated-like protein [Pedobacter cryoconitis]|uniref:Gliding motility-associated-like protein n=1 Tax=Pedobacter cryoconitis TaxID=188932 RepID=A0A7W9E0W7_9SPHI|nr:MBG domain-containing protein [Pedobacter cryoconitis]MBB5637749.1 gliding motility-associated-like protein [Pedobacter cryoconitis]